MRTLLLLGALALLVSAGLFLPLSLSAHETGTPLRDRVKLGAYVQGLPYYDRSTKEFARLEQKLGTKLPILSGFVDWDYPIGGERDLALAAQGTRTLLYSWEPHCLSEGECISFAKVAAGAYDPYLLRVAENMRHFPYDLYVRPWGEMNADWSAWQPGSDKQRAGTPEEFIQAWRHVHDLFKKQKVENLKFVFNPDATDDESTVPVTRIWPGAEYVEVLGIDGYNWGLGVKDKPGQWRDFDDIFASMYQTLTALHPSAPVWICEVGSKEPEKDDGNVRPAPRDRTHKKGAWIDAMMSSTRFPRVAALVVFNVFKERDFRFESSSDSLRAMRRQLSLRSAASATQ
ncbi:MAG: hypothetical protein JWN48_2773 [Myxococcaceae bacterium]|nr:hypothetical protein [Myxococcaceae bacterium]